MQSNVHAIALRARKQRFLKRLMMAPEAIVNDRAIRQVKIEARCDPLDHKIFLYDPHLYAILAARACLYPEKSLSRWLGRETSVHARFCLGASPSDLRGHQMIRMRAHLIVAVAEISKVDQTPTQTGELIAGYSAARICFGDESKSRLSTGVDKLVCNSIAGFEAA